MRFLPLSRENKPLVAYRDNPLLKAGLEYGDWVNEAVEQDFGVGVFLDNSGLVVIDTDSAVEFGRHSKQVFGWSAFKDVCKELGLPGIPGTFTVETKTSGHYHFYFKQHPDYPLTRTSIHSQIPQVDIKVTGYVVSWHTKGYKIVRDTDIRVLPSALGKRLYRGGLESVPGNSAQECGVGERTITPGYADYLLTEISHTCNGERNAKLYRAARTFQGAGLTDPSSRSRLLQAAVTAGLRDTEAERTIESAWK